MSEQLVFDLPVRPALGRDDFFVSEANAHAAEAIAGWRDWPGGKLVLVGPPGAGKTHLAHVWAADSGALVVPASRLDEADIARLSATPVAVDAAGPETLTPEAQRNFFHLHNELASRRLPLLVTAREAPARWQLALRDLASRLEAAPVARLNPPDDALLAAVLMKHFTDRQLAPSPAAVAWLARRLERSFAAAAEVVRRLDRAALAQRRPLSRDFVAAMVDNWPELTGDTPC